MVSIVHHLDQNEWTLTYRIWNLTPPQQIQVPVFRLVYSLAKERDLGVPRQKIYPKVLLRIRPRPQLYNNKDLCFPGGHWRRSP